MAYQGSRGVAWIDRVTKKLTQTPDGADRLSRWLIWGFTLLMLSFALMGLAMAVAGSDNGAFVAFSGMLGGSLVRIGFQPGIHLGIGTDERERLIAWKSMALGCGLGVIVLLAWLVGNGATGGSFLWVPQMAKQWYALAFATLALVQSVALIAIVWMQPPYLAEPDEELGI